jgi:hypothetical protein
MQVFFGVPLSRPGLTGLQLITLILTYGITYFFSGGKRVWGRLEGKKNSLKFFRLFSVRRVTAFPSIS